jgi:hypothetical protein
VNPLVKSIPRNVLIHLLTDTRNAVERAEAVPVTEQAKSDGVGIRSAEISLSGNTLNAGWWDQSPAWSGKRDILLTVSSGLEAWRPGWL